MTTGVVDDDYHHGNDADMWMSNKYHHRCHYSETILQKKN